MSAPNEIGEELARLCDAQIAKLIEHGELSEDHRCEGCAFRKGSEANNTPDTLAWAAQCVRTKHPFYCHCVPEVGEKICAGWAAMFDAKAKGIV